MERLILPVAAMICGTLLLAFFMLVRHRKREMLHRERLARIEKGLPVPDLDERPHFGRHSMLLPGLAFTFAGLGMLAGWVMFVPQVDSGKNSPLYILAVLPLSIGLAQLIYYFVESWKRGRS